MAFNHTTIEETDTRHTKEDTDAPASIMSSPSKSAIVSTPKRKRSELQDDDTDVPFFNTLSPHNIALPPSSPADDGSTSPRTNVAHRFRSLAIGKARTSTETTTRIRFAPATRDFTATIPETPQYKPQGDDAMLEDADGIDCGARKRLKLPHDEARTAEDNDLPPLSKPPRSRPTFSFAINRPGTPPLRKSASPPADSPDTDTPKPSPPSATGFMWPPSPPSPTSQDSPTVAFRASMTWREEEITIYDPDDSDDDGTGINGIGFKPTPAVAYARGVKRQQQLAEYRKREEREARARRSQRRRGTQSPRPAADEKKLEKKSGEHKEKQKEKERRKVRFEEESLWGPAMTGGGEGVGVAT